MTYKCSHAICTTISTLIFPQTQLLGQSLSRGCKTFHHSKNEEKTNLVNFTCSQCTYTFAVPSWVSLWSNGSWITLVMKQSFQFTSITLTLINQTLLPFCITQVFYFVIGRQQITQVIHRIKPRVKEKGKHDYESRELKICT